jgi:SAM-dependent methyltransferase
MFFESFARHQRSDRRTSVGSWNWQRLMRKKFDILKQSGLRDGTCLEIGPGEGDFARLCAAAGIGYQAVERNPTYQQKLQAEGFDVELGTVPPLPFPDERFDAICIMAVLEHMPTFEQAIELLSESYRVLKPDGLLAIEVPDFLRAGINFYAWDYTHSFPTTIVRLEQILFDCGFSPIRTVSLTGSLSATVIRWPIDLVGFIVHSRLVYWLVMSLGGRRFLEKYHKTFEPAIYIVSRKIDR